jgi:hypothetical protein
MYNLPDFTKYGFHTNTKFRVIKSNGEKLIAIYHGYGLFSTPNSSELFNDIIAWETILS